MYVGIHTHTPFLKQMLKVDPNCERFHSLILYNAFDGHKTA